MAKIWSNPTVHWVWVGETHGTREIPELFGEMVCAALKRGFDVSIGVERPASEQGAIDRLLNSEDLKGAKANLLNQPEWQRSYDGRTSEAVLSLLESFRHLKATYPSLSVHAIVDPAAFASSPSANDQAMGSKVLALWNGQPNSLVMLLSGNVHGFREPFRGYKTAAMYIPSDQLLSLEVTETGGEVWMLSGGSCGVHSGGIVDRDKGRPAGVYLGPTLAPVGVVDGIVALDKPVSPSPPAGLLVNRRLRGRQCGSF